MITVSHVTKTYGDQVLFSDVSLSISAKDKIGLIGRNGSGKSTFLKILLDQDSYDHGTIEIPKKLHIASLEQHLEFSAPNIVAQVALSLPKSKDNQSWKAESILLGLGFTTDDFSRAPEEFSSGMQVRLRLAAALVSPSHLLLLDEPTNYLDIVSLRWLERFLQQWNQAFVLVTHDQQFMERVITHTVAIHRGKMRKMRGGPVKMLTQIQKDEFVQENTRLNTAKKQAKTKEFISKFRAGARSAGLVQSRIKALEKQKVPEKLDKLPKISFQFRALELRANALLEARNISFSYDEQPLIEDFSLKVYAKDRIAIVGRNGKGKSTLLQLLINKLPKSSGTLKQHVDLQVGYFAAGNKDALDPTNTILSELLTLPDVSEQEIRSVCGSLLFTGEAVKKHISHLSGGEKSRVCFAKVLLSAVHVLVLDEPTNHLDLESCQALTLALQEFPGTVIFVTHDEKILSSLANRLVVFDDGNIAVYEKSYDEFLDEIGWAEENEAGVSQKKSTKITDTKQQYLEIKDARKQLRLVQSRQTKLLKVVEALERQQVETSDLLQKAYSESNRDMMEKYGRTTKQLAEDIAQQLTELEDAIAQEEHLKRLIEELGK